MTDAERSEDDVDVFSDDIQEPSSETDGEWIELPSAGLLSVESADELLRWRAARLVAVVGARNSGKTTLIAETYERFIRGTFGGQIFTQSWTLHGFEQKTFQSRAQTGSDIPDTPRTSRNDGLRFFHLALTAEQSGERTDLLISERAGEVYFEARDQPETARSLLELVRARTIVFVVDGERVANKLTRSDAFGSVRALVRAFSDAGAIPHDAEVQIVTTKFDLMDGEGGTEAQAALADFEQRIRASFGDRFSRLTVWRTAARDPSGQMEAAWGVADLLNSWVESQAPPEAPSVELPPITDMFDRLLLKQA